jgi:hypothetical protein
MPETWHICPVSFNSNTALTGEYSDTLLAVSSWQLAVSSRAAEQQSSLAVLQ